MSNADPDQQRFSENLDNINRLCHHYGLDEELTRELRRYCFQTIELHYAESRASAFARLTPTLVERVTWQMNEHWIQRVPCLNYGRFVSEHERRRFLVALVLQMQPKIYAPKEVPPGKHLYFIRQGSVLYRSPGLSAVLGPGAHWGETDVLLLQPRPLHAVTGTYTHVLCVGRDQLYELGDAFPNAFRSMRTWTIFRVVWREMIATLRRSKAHERRQQRRLHALTNQKSNTNVLARPASPTSPTTGRKNSVVTFAPITEVSDASPPPAVAEAAPAPDVPAPALLGTPECPTDGSALHCQGACRPCAHVFTKGCANGVGCSFCHLCGPGELKRRQRERRVQLARQKPLEPRAEVGGSARGRRGGKRA